MDETDANARSKNGDAVNGVIIDARNGTHRTRSKSNDGHGPAINAADEFPINARNGTPRT